MTFPGYDFSPGVEIKGSFPIEVKIVLSLTAPPQPVDGVVASCCLTYPGVGTGKFQRKFIAFLRGGVPQIPQLPHLPVIVPDPVFRFGGMLFIHPAVVVCGVIVYGNENIFQISHTFGSNSCSPCPAQGRQ